MATLVDLCTVTGGELHGPDAAFNAVSTDTRTLQGGDVFFALRGERFDAAEFVAEAARAGAAGAVVEQQMDASLPLITVSDTRVALGDFAREWRRRSDARVIGITGSNGKTTVKELIAGICRAAFGDDAVLATRGNLNNDIGLPLTLLELRSEHRIAVAEMGANHPGEIGELAGIALPDIAVITNVARAHIEGFGSLDGVARTKGALLDRLGAEGTAVLNADDDYFDTFRERAGAATIVSFGHASHADYYAENVTAVVRRGVPGFSFELHCPAGSATIVLPLPGKHNVSNALAAAAAAMAAGATLDHVAAGLASARSVPGRMRAFRSASGAMIFDDCYNANPDSVAAALATLAEFNGEAWLVLGDMGELGPDAAELHRETGRLARESAAAGLLCTGEMGRDIAAGFGAGARWFESVDELEAALRDELLPGRNVLIKASRFMQLDRLVDALESDATAGGGD